MTCPLCICCVYNAHNVPFPFPFQGRPRAGQTRTPNTYLHGYGAHQQAKPRRVEHIRRDQETRQAAHTVKKDFGDSVGSSGHGLRLVRRRGVGRRPGVRRSLDCRSLWSPWLETKQRGALEKRRTNPHPASTRFAHTRQASTDPASFTQRAAGPTRATAHRTDRAE